VGLFFTLQLVTGIFLAMHYTAHVELAFDSVVHIMTDVKNGWLVRYMHANGASMVFILLYSHIARGLYYRSYLYARRYIWWSGLIIFILMMATAFIGYVLPWGQMSFWGATVITSLVTAIPFIGENIAYWIWGGFSISNATLVRFFSLHYLLPFVIIGIILLHLVVLHQVGSTDPVQTISPEKIPFHPYYTYKDGFGLAVFLLVFMFLVFFYPNLLGHSDNFIKANPLVTPAHIVPEWYFTPFYAILRACPNKLGGVISMVAALLILFILPFYSVSLRTTPSTLSPFYKLAFWTFFFTFLILMFLGGQAAAAPFVVCSKIFTVLYFMYFIVVLPNIDRLEAAILGNKISVPRRSIFGKIPFLILGDPLEIQSTDKDLYQILNWIGDESCILYNPTPVPLNLIDFFFIFILSIFILFVYIYQYEIKRWYPSKLLPCPPAIYWHFLEVSSLLLAIFLKRVRVIVIDVWWSDLAAKQWWSDTSLVWQPIFDRYFVHLCIFLIISRLFVRVIYRHIRLKCLDWYEIISLNFCCAILMAIVVSLNISVWISSCFLSSLMEAYPPGDWDEIFGKFYIRGMLSESEIVDIIVNVVSNCNQHGCFAFPKEEAFSVFWHKTMNEVYLPKLIKTFQGEGYTLGMYYLFEVLNKIQIQYIEQLNIVVPLLTPVAPPWYQAWFNTLIDIVLFGF
jgi:quinol-cytochrome oxidoreductase complex cytochrome b subunit